MTLSSDKTMEHNNSQLGVKATLTHEYLRKNIVAELSLDKI